MVMLLASVFTGCVPAFTHDCQRGVPFGFVVRAHQAGFRPPPHTISHTDDSMHIQIAEQARKQESKKARKQESKPECKFSRQECSPSFVARE
jgi:hypothetical protein